MSYVRVIPRDLFNEGNLLKCLGALYIELDKRGLSSLFSEDNLTYGFGIDQNPDDGSISAYNVPLIVRGQRYRLYRPLNSRQPWPLWLENTSDSDFEPVEVFNDDGSLSASMVAFLA